MKKEKSIVKSGIILSLMTFASRIMGLIRESTKAAFLGTGLFADCFSVAFQIPNLLRRLFAENAISVAFIPTFKEYLKKGDDDESKKQTQEFIASTLTLVTFLTACIVIIGILITPWITPIFCKKPVLEKLQFLPDFPHFFPLFGKVSLNIDPAEYQQQMDYWLAQRSEITILTRIMFPYLFLISIAAFFQGVLNGCNIFAPSGFTPVLFNTIVIAATYILAPHTSNPARAMSIGVITGGSIQAIFQWPFIRKTGWKIRLTSLKKTFTNPGTRKVVSLIVPTIIGIAAYQLNDLVSTSMATRAGEGIASSLQYSLRLQELILGIFAVSIGTVILPDMSGLANEQKWDEFNEILIQAIKIMTLISIPVTAYSLVSGKELISLLYKTKKFDDASVALTLGEFRFHIAGLLFIALNRIISPAFYAQGNTKLPTLAGIISFASNILFVFMLIKPMGGRGIALALSLASLINTVFLFIFMRKMHSIQIKKILKEAVIYGLKMCLFAVIAAVPCYFIRPLLVSAFEAHGRVIAYGVPVLLTALIYFAVGVLELIITKDDIVKAILQKIRKK